VVRSAVTRSKIVAKFARIDLAMLKLCLWDDNVTAGHLNVTIVLGAFIIRGLNKHFVSEA